MNVSGPLDTFERVQKIPDTFKTCPRSPLTILGMFLDRFLDMFNVSTPKSIDGWTRLNVS